MKRTVHASEFSDLGDVTEVRLVAECSARQQHLGVPEGTDLSMDFDDVSLREVGP